MIDLRQTGLRDGIESLLTSNLTIDVSPIRLDAILGLREEYRREMNCQIVHDSWHARGFTHSYLFRLAGEVVGYGSVGGVPQEPKTIIKEFFVLPRHRGAALPIFQRLVAVSDAETIEAQTNDVLLSLMLHDCGIDLASDTILFSDAISTNHEALGVKLRPLTDADRARVFRHTVEPIGDWGLESDYVVVATGGLFFHYNPPYGDIYMEVAEPFRRRGFGSYLVQELKRIGREGGMFPLPGVTRTTCHRGSRCSGLGCCRARGSLEVALPPRHR